MSKISQQIQSIIDKDDPNQKLIGMLSILIEEKFEQIDERFKIFDEKLDNSIERIENEIGGVTQKINNQERKTQLHDVQCPHRLDDRIVEIENQIDWIKTLQKYKYITLLVIIGIASLLAKGLDKIVDFIK